MKTRLGHSLKSWNRAKQEAKQVLVERAKVRGMITYQELSDKITAIHIDYHSEAMNVLLEEISREEDAAGRGMLSAIVVHKLGDMQPGSGFFKLCELLGKDTSDILKIWIEELNKVYAYWSNVPPTE